MKQYIGIYLRGLAMGAADVVPGVSGGTIAFITGIYAELVESIGKLDAKALQVLFKQGPVAFFKHVNGAFLLSLVLGIGTSIVALAKLITHLLATEPIKLWSFFFGLILASAIYIGRQLSWKGIKEFLPLIFGIAAAYWISTLSPSGGDVGMVYVFFSGAIAICAMILPGISGSFILLLLGAYATVFGAIGNATDDLAGNLPIILAFMLGAGIGLLSFAKLLSWLFANHNTSTMAVLTGFMIGSLNKVWPWKEVLSTRVNSKGEVVPLLERSVSPSTFTELSGADPQMLYAGLFFVAGLVVVLLLSRFSPEDA